MNEVLYVVDSDIFIDVLRKKANVHERIMLELASNSRFVLCPVVYYEVRRGLLDRDASAQLQVFDALTETFQYESLVKDDWKNACVEWARLKQQGTAVGDRDILISVFARRLGAIVVSGNEKHFQALNADFENWRN